MLSQMRSSSSHTHTTKTIVTIATVLILTLFVEWNSHFLRNLSQNNAISKPKPQNGAITKQSGDRHKSSASEYQIPGWEENVSRKAEDYIQYNELTALIMPEFKSGRPSGTQVLVVIFTDPKRFNMRKAIRQTSGKDCSEHPNCDLLFLVGTPEADTEAHDTQNDLENEAALYQDILQEKFNDTYFNLTLKALFMLKYVNSSETQYDYVLKLNDDTFFSVPALFGVIAELEMQYHDQSVVAGYHKLAERPIRGLRGNAKMQRWRVPYYHYADKFYPKYLAGCATLFSRAALRCHYEAAFTEPVMIIEDVYITGTLANLCNTTRLHSNSFHAMEDRNGFQPDVHVTFHEATTATWLSWYELIPRRNASNWLQSYVPNGFQLEA